MDKATKDYATLYQQEDPEPPVQLLATHFDPFKINDEVPLVVEVEVVVAIQRLRPHKSGGHTHIHAEHFKTWLCKAYLGEEEKLLKIWKMYVSHGHSPVYLEHHGDDMVIGVYHNGLDPQGKHRHPGDRPPGDALEGCGVHYWYPPLIQHPVPQCPPQVPRRLRQENSNHWDQDSPGACQCWPIPPLPKIPRPEEGLWHSRPRLTHQFIGRLWRGTTYVQSPCNLMSPSRGCHKPQRVPQPELYGTTQGRLISPTLFNLVVDNVLLTGMAMTFKYQAVA